MAERYVGQPLNERLEELEKKVERLDAYTHREVPDNYGYIQKLQKEISELKEEFDKLFKCPFDCEKAINGLKERLSQLDGDSKDDDPAYRELKEWTKKVRKEINGGEISVGSERGKRALDPLKSEGGRNSYDPPRTDSNPLKCDECEIGIADPTLDECKLCYPDEKPSKFKFKCGHCGVMFEVYHDGDGYNTGFCSDCLVLYDTVGLPLKEKPPEPIAGSARQTDYIKWIYTEAHLNCLENFRIVLKDEILVEKEDLENLSFFNYIQFKEKYLGDKE